MTMLAGSSGKPAGTVLEFSIKDVFNPISTDTVAVLTVRTTDAVGGIID